MSNSESQSQSSAEFRTRRGHRKSRNGCSECKRRRLKCDELKPKCGRCVALLEDCIYIQIVPKERRGGCPPGPRLSILPLSPEFPSYVEQIQAVKVPQQYSPVDLNLSSLGDLEDAPGLSDSDLYHHYIQHTSRTLTYSKAGQIPLQIGIPTLALRNKTVLHSTLALSAACMGCDMISKHPSPSLTAVDAVLMSGYRHYNAASEQLREMISQLDHSKVEPLLASNMLLVPFSAAVQQIEHWISSRRETRNFRNLLSSTPRDIIVIMRGIRTMNQVLKYCDWSPDLAVQDTDSAINTLDFDIKTAVSCTSHDHVMFSVLAATSQKAFAQLQQRLDLAETKAAYARHPNGYLSACVSAYEVLDEIRVRTFSLPRSTTPASPTSKARKPVEIKQAWLPQLAPWLRDLITKPAIPSPSGPLTSPFLSFLVQVPQSYIDLIMPLLAQRLETANTISMDDVPVPLTAEQALALDIYAHWSVLMFLVQEESWWIGSLPVVTLTGMINKFGDDFVAGLQPHQDHTNDAWWPGTMLGVMRETQGS